MLEPEVTVNPATFLPTDNIFTSCRKGNLERIRHLVEMKEIDVNVRDCWDSSPLYYACLCGHQEVVKYLLEKGATCEENTFDGERCLYGALTKEIRLLLVASNATGINTTRRDGFNQFCEKLAGSEDYSDFTVRLSSGKLLKLHRCVLASRSPGLNDLLTSGKWRDQDFVKISHVDPLIFEEFVKYLYTGKLKITRDQYDPMIQLGKRCGMSTFTEQLENCLKKSVEIENLKAKAIRVTTLVLDNTLTRQLLERDYFDILDAGLGQVGGGLDPFYRLRLDDHLDKKLDKWHDVILKADGAMFSCNKVFLCARSEFLKVLVENPLGEVRERINGKEVVQLQGISSAVLGVILAFIYTNVAVSLNNDNVFDVLENSDVYLLPGLTKLCGSFISGLVTHDNVIDLLQTARIRSLPQLEDRCTEYLAENIAFFIGDSAFQDLVREDAETVVGRQETDTIPVIDDIRYHINLTSQVTATSSGGERELTPPEKFEMIDTLLKELNLDA